MTSDADIMEQMAATVRVVLTAMQTTAEVQGGNPAPDDDAALAFAQARLWLQRGLVRWRAGEGR